MGTNYYLYTDVCDYCDREAQRLHIGKSSGGWCFGLHVLPKQPYHEEGDLVINDLDDWQTLWYKPRAVIKNEYREVLTPEAMMHIITERSGRLPEDSSFYFANQAEPGPNGLARSRIDGRHCIGHGKGTWDLIIGGFS